ncbi:hypothetical protein [Deinococcus wulumuqiensis]|uniref:hypothetical protein n=1 Tax=Deinococcus wulumuqiensis TaxID=980427 RepID=UPI0013C33889|nr:hypothetical protein [Deinococcus wulumuqiensis]
MNTISPALTLAAVLLGALTGIALGWPPAAWGDPLKLTVLIAMSLLGITCASVMELPRQQGNTPWYGLMSFTGSGNLT